MSEEALRTLRTDTEVLLPSLPTFDRDCEERVLEYTPPSDDAPHGERSFRDCTERPTYLLKSRAPRSARAADERRLNCREHALEGAPRWRPVTLSIEHLEFVTRKAVVR